MQGSGWFQWWFCLLFHTQAVKVIISDTLIAANTITIKNIILIGIIIIITIKISFSSTSSASWSPPCYFCARPKTAGLLSHFGCTSPPTQKQYDDCNFRNVRKLDLVWFDISNKRQEWKQETIQWTSSHKKRWAGQKWNIAKGTTDPRVEFILPKELLEVLSWVLTQSLLKHFQNLDQESTSESQPNINIST